VVGEVPNEAGSAPEFPAMDIMRAVHYEPSKVPTEMLVDYVRVWQHPPSSPKSAILTKSGELLEFARNNTGELIEYGRYPDGEWSRWDITSLSTSHTTISNTPSVIETPSGEIDVFARSGSNSLVDFGRTTNGAWSAFNVSGNVNTPIVSEAAPIMEGSTILVFTFNAAGEVMQFARTSNGAWSVWNITSLSNGHPDVSTVPEAVFTPSGELDVFARNSNGNANELIDFGRNTVGAWTAFNVSGATGTNIASDASPLMEGSTILVFTFNAAHEVMQFARTSSGAWSAWNVSALSNGHPDVSSVPSAVFTPSGELDAFARNSSGDADELIDFGRNTVGAWSPFDVSGATSTYISSNETALMEGSKIIVFAHNTSGQVIQFDRESSGAWYAWNLASLAGEL
jgi:hypothetical protein